ncbi:MAG: helix-turn-helix domain-containing protein [Firmicutes bacterium]|nr:helix-turn-helix domain-containing protein [[Eubacterium] siraeum]MCM1486828.1 helix-turn-helix domain-containing protein [Bacillota bacterium]
MTTKIPVLFDVLKERGITQKKLSEDTGISTGNISDWKSGKSSPKPAALSKIAQYLGCSVDYLLGNTDNPKGTKSTADPDLAEAIQLFANLPEERRKALLNFMKAFCK